MKVYQLFAGKRFSGISVEPDPTWPEMWRVRQGDRVSGMLNLTRARDAGRACALSADSGFGPTPVIWKCSEMDVVASPIEFDAVA